MTMTVGPVRSLSACVLTWALACAPRAWGAEPASPAAIDLANRLESQGRFAAAAETLQAALHEPSLPTDDRRRLEFEFERLDRIRRDYPLTEDALFEQLQRAVRDLSAREWQGWVNDGRFDWREIDGRRCFMKSSVSNLFWRHPDLQSRRVAARDESAYQRALWETCVAVKQAAQAAGKPVVLPQRFHVKMTVVARPDAAPDGQRIRAWLPVPRRFPYQGEFELVGSSSPILELAPEDSPIRSAFLEQPARLGRETEFWIEYRYTAHGVWHDIRAEQVRPLEDASAELAPFLSPAPHVSFTPELRALAGRIAAGQTNPARVAKACYDWIADNIRYSYAVEYSTVRDLGDDCRRRGYGDCGQEAMLFIALCRLQGIPARWQSGWSVFPGHENIHDWAEVYLPPFGWIPVDPWAGVIATQYATTLSGTQRRELSDFYFGGLDPYRMAANRDHCQDLTPPKRTLRSDPVDFQRGELEWDTHNIYFDRFTYRFDVTAGQ